MMKKSRRKLKLKNLIVLIIIVLSPMILVNQPNILKVSGTLNTPKFNANSMCIVDLEHDEIMLSVNKDSKLVPASLAKLFTIDYANTICDVDEEVLVKEDVLSFVKEGSSVAGLRLQPYYMQNLYAAMLVPSGNDAAYVVADYVGGKINPEASNAKERIDSFMNGLNAYIRKMGYKDTVLNDPSGFDLDATTTVMDLTKCVEHLLENDWIREIVSDRNYVVYLPDGSTQTYTNTNKLVDYNSEYYNENVIGFKTGSIAKKYNLVVLYQKNGKEYLICSLGAQSDFSRYDDATEAIKYIER